ncbi:transposase [Variovorax sp. LjRoot290]|uniref:transposase n=1 Tax=Variovorax sp. LjRoot290 TaxID=3342316 RepID=UPI003F50F058
MPARRRRTRGAEFKAQAVQACREPGMSMTAVAMAHGVNANLPRRWVTEQDDASDQHDFTGCLPPSRYWRRISATKWIEWLVASSSPLRSRGGVCE